MTTRQERNEDHVTRQEIHHRQIDFKGYQRDDGLFEVEAHLTDCKSFDFTPPGGTTMFPAHTPIHDLYVRVIFDQDMLIRNVLTNFVAHPYFTCIGGGDKLKAIIGLRIGAGWNLEIRKRLPACESCTHMRELLTPLASAAYQTMTARRTYLLHATKDDGTPRKINSCYAYRATGGLVEQLWPDFHQPATVE